MPDPAIRRALYVLFARLLSGAPDPALYRRLLDGGLQRLAEAQGLDLTSDLLDDDDPDAAAAELGVEWSRLDRDVSLCASDYPAGANDPVAALGAFLREHRLHLGADASRASICSGNTGCPHSTCNPSASLPQRRATSSHLSENAPFMQHRTRLATRFRMAPSITPHADEVERCTSCLVPKTCWSCGCTLAWRFLKSWLRWPIIGAHMAAKVFSLTSIGPGMCNFKCAIEKRGATVSQGAGAGKNVVVM
jgi:hypothetical protein